MSDQQSDELTWDFSGIVYRAKTKWGEISILPERGRGGFWINPPWGDLMYRNNDGLDAAKTQAQQMYLEKLNPTGSNKTPVVPDLSATKISDLDWITPGIDYATAQTIFGRIEVIKAVPSDPAHISLPWRKDLRPLADDMDGAKKMCQRLYEEYLRAEHRKILDCYEYKD
jgi:hypothetical protein